jgi:hypothetical protein
MITITMNSLAFLFVALIMSSACWRSTTNYAVVVDGHAWGDVGGRLMGIAAASRRRLTEGTNDDDAVGGLFHRHNRCPSPFSSSSSTAVLSTDDGRQQRGRRSLPLPGRRREGSSSSSVQRPTIDGAPPVAVATSVRREIQADVRGGTTMAGHLVRTMTARRMETFK